MGKDLLENAVLEMEQISERKTKLQKELNAWGKNKTFVVVKDCFKTPYCTTGTNFKGRECKLRFDTYNNGILCHPVFKNKRSGEFDLYIDYSYGPDYFELKG